jgi:hypothetical protein
VPDVHPVEVTVAKADRVVFEGRETFPTFPPSPPSTDRRSPCGRPESRDRQGGLFRAGLRPGGRLVSIRSAERRPGGLARKLNSGLYALLPAASSSTQPSSTLAVLRGVGVVVR